MLRDAHRDGRSAGPGCPGRVVVRSPRAIGGAGRDARRTVFALAAIAWLAAAFLVDAAQDTRWLAIRDSQATAAEMHAARALPDGFEFSVATPGLEAQIVARREGRFAEIGIPKSGYTDVIGEPRLPVVRRLLVVPAGARVSVEANGQARTLVLKQNGFDCPVLPLQPPIPKLAGGADNIPFEIKSDLYQQDRAMPDVRARVVEAGTVSGRRLVLVEILPVAYNPVRGELSVFPDLNIRVRWQGDKAAASAPLTPREEKALGALAMNFVPSVQGGTSHGRLLIIAHTSLATNLTTYVDHKTAHGWTVDLADTTAAGTTTNAIRDFIRSRYTNLATRADAVLLVGDVAQIPRFVGTTTATPDTDLYYACMDSGDDWQPEFPVGRFSVADVAQLSAVVAKTIAYETATASGWMARAAFMASQDNYTISEGTHNWVIDTYMSSNQYASDKLYCQTYATTTPQVTAAFNAGRAFGIYSGHGSDTSWADGPVFTQANINSLTNAPAFPFIGSFACLTGHYSVNECLAETWQRAAGKGGIAVLASSVESTWTEDDILEKVLFTAIFGEGNRAFGAAVFRAKSLYLQHFGATTYTRQYFEQYNFFGDPTVDCVLPELMIANDSPLPLAYAGIAYSNALTAGWGTKPYQWEIVSGALPDGLALAGDSGLITGIPTNAGTATFTVRVTDAAALTDTRTFQLPVVSQLSFVTPSAMPAASVNVPYSLMLQVQGGVPPYQIALPIKAYKEVLSSGAPLGGGTAKGWRDDDGSWQMALPWPFPFYDSNRTSVWVCSNGYIDFTSSAAEYAGTTATLATKTRIAALWLDLDTRATGDDIYVTTNADRVVIRWAAHTYWQQYPANAEIVLTRDGTIAVNYGAAQTNFGSGIGIPVIGVSKGDGSAYTVSSLNGASTIPANQTSTFAPQGLPYGLVLETNGWIHGTATGVSTNQFCLSATDAGSPTQTITKDYTLCVVNGVELIVSSACGVPEPAPGIHFYAQGTNMTCTVDGSTAVCGTTQYVYRGWAGTGSIPATGAGTAVGPLALTNNSSIAWLWQTNFLLDTGANGCGTVDVADAWVPAGSNVVVHALPATYYHFNTWTGDTAACLVQDAQITAPMSGPRQITAMFAATLAPMGTPEWWLACHGLTNGTPATEELCDPDHDGLRVWQECAAGTDPTNVNSTFELTSAERDAADRELVRWTSVSNRLYSIWLSTNSLDSFSMVTNHVPATPPQNVYTGGVSQATRVFYRVEVEQP